jgi:hypothetical protein
MKTFIHDPSPESLITDTRTRQEGELNRAQSERHYQQTFGQPTIQQTDLGPVLVDKQAGTARSIRDESGNVIQSDKPLTEVQGKATMFGSRMEAASKILNELESKAGFNVTSPLNRFAGASGVTSPLNYLASKDAQSYKQAQRNWSEAELRFKTGAAVTEREIEDNEKIYFPQPGDGKEQIAQKALARQQAEAGMRVAMGSRGVRQDPQQQPGTPSLSAIEAELRRRGIK